MRHHTLQTLRRAAPVLAAALAISSCVRPSAPAATSPEPAPVTRPASDEQVRFIEPAAQTSGVEADVMQTVRRLFDGMRAGDSAMVRSVFDSGARLVTVAVRNGVPRIERGSLDGFVRAVGTPRADVWDERISDEVVHVDGPLATAWMRYRFYAGSKFSHCGVNSFELIRTSDGWRVSSIADTRRREGCDEPAE